MSDYLYLGCDWRIRPLDAELLQKMVDTLQSIDEEARLTIVEYGEDLVGCKMATWIVRVPSMKVLDEFKIQMSDDLNLRDWYLVSQGKVMQGINLNWHVGIANLYESLRVIGIHNNRILENLKGTIDTSE